MKTILSSRRHHYVARACIFLIVVALIAGIVGCEPIPTQKYNLTIACTTGGSVTTPGEETSTYDEGEVVNLVATPDAGYYFVEWTGDVSEVADVEDANTTITMNDHYSITANFALEILEIWDWYDLHAIRDNLDRSYLLMNDVDANTDGYQELASPTANQGQGWQPIGTFTGSLDGQGYEIRDLFIDRPDQDGIGLFGWVDEGDIENLGVVSADVTGGWLVGGLVGQNMKGGVSNSYSTGSVTGAWLVGGLVGQNEGTVSNSYSTGGVIGNYHVGGLVGITQGTVSNSYSTGSVTGSSVVGGLVGSSGGTVSNSHYNYDEVLINGENVITIGALSDQDFDQWLTNDKSMDVDERLSQEDGYYLINDVSDFEQLLVFGQDDSLKFRLKNNLDLATEPNFYVPYLAGEFDGNGHRISSLSFDFDFVGGVGLFGYLASGGKVTEVCAENVNITGHSAVGGLVGGNGGTVSNSYSTGRVAGYLRIGGLVGTNCGGTVSNSHYNYNEVLINDRHVITIGALFDEDFDQWLAGDKSLDISDRFSQENGYYLINDVSDFEQLLAFGQDDSLKFRLKNDLNLATEPNFYIPYLAGEFDGNGHKISSLSIDFDFVSQLGLFGYLASGGKVGEVCAENVNIVGDFELGGLVGFNNGTVGNSYATGSVSGLNYLGVLVGWNDGTVSNSYCTGSVTGDLQVGGLMGFNGGTVSNSYSIASVTGNQQVGGLVGFNILTVSNSFWDVQASGQATSAGGTGKTTAEMQDIATFSGAAWNIVGVGPGDRDPAYIWNIVDGQTYPFLSWQFVS